MTSDIESHVYRAKLEAKYRGWDVYEGENQEWQLIDANNPYLVTNHPLSRTIYVHVIQSPEEILPFVDDDTQTIGLYPLDKYAVEIA
ncbi:acyl-CoA reductase, partial [Streptococcus pyogenes]